MDISMFRQNRFIALLVGALLVSLSLISLLGMQTSAEQTEKSKPSLVNGKPSVDSAQQAGEASRQSTELTSSTAIQAVKPDAALNEQLGSNENQPFQLPAFHYSSQLQGWKPEPDKALSIPEPRQQESESDKEEAQAKEKATASQHSKSTAKPVDESTEDSAPKAQAKPKNTEGTHAVNAKANSLHPPTTLFFTRTKTLTQNEKQHATWEYALSAEELLLLQKIVMAEAEGEPYEGKVAVANVVLNRLRSANFPDTIRNVIYQKHQFSPVANGRMDRVKPSEETIKAVHAALHGEKAVSDDTYFFLSLTLAQDLTVHHSRTFAKKIGNHSFYK